MTNTELLTTAKKHLTAAQFADLKTNTDSVDNAIINHLVDCIKCRNTMSAVDDYFHHNMTVLAVEDVTTPFSNSAGEENIKSITSLTKHSKKIEPEKKEKNNSIGRLSLPSFAIAASIFITFIVSMWINTSDEAAHFLAVYQDPDGISISSPPVGIGFFDERNIKKQTISNVNLTMSDKDNILMSWPDFAKSKNYHVQVNEAGHNSIFEKTISTNMVSFPLALFKKGRHYQWTISHTSAQNITHEIQGGFVLTHDTQAKIGE